VRVSVICLADRPDRLPCLYWSLVAQTLTTWRLLILHQGEADVLKHIPSPLPLNVDYRHVERLNDWGQTAKEQAAKDWAKGEALMFPNDDAYYAPPALEKMAIELERGADLALCGWVFDKLGYVPYAPAPIVGRVDVGGFMVKRDWFLKVGWRDKSDVGDGRFIEALVAHGAKVAKVPAVVYVKN
jgi:hypothetical protein